VSVDEQDNDSKGLLGAVARALDAVRASGPAGVRREPVIARQLFGLLSPAAGRELCHRTATRPTVRGPAGPTGCQVPSQADWAAVDPQPRGSAGLTVLLAAYRGQSGGAGRVALLTAPRAQALQLHESSSLSADPDAAGTHGVAGAGPSPWAGGRWRISAA
jgi:hypothetical protein